MEKPMAESVEQ